MLKEKGFHRGVNLGGWMSQCDYSIERLDGFINEKDFETIASWGADHVRLPVDYDVAELLDDGIARIRRAVDKTELAAYEGKNVVLGIRPEDLHAEPAFFGEGNAIRAYIDLDEMMGSESYLYLEYAGQKLIARVPARYAKKAEENIELAIDIEKIHLFDKESELAI